ncbi:hypothetical protein OCU04_000516 [Sclerotinia nivalis]|uniref:Alcohol dehydrogenase-like C-terminal domain-containing protein n=1 Tax=Sclerotinia nivalis TaxID=352851 RepID=A0A9X0AZL7_9HELO|nr:hypothetical protein OCU04_000516 [Sclerotinia nivalis]
MEFQASASLGATALVSYDTVAVREDLRRGEIVLMHAAAGGLGLMSVQIAKAFEARVIATAPIKEKLEVARKFGAYECLDNFGGQEWWKTILEQTGGKGVDLVFDSVGLVDLSLKCLSHERRVYWPLGSRAEKEI